jgi:hypothetical protein
MEPSMSCACGAPSEPKTRSSRHGTGPCNTPKRCKHVACQHLKKTCISSFSRTATQPGCCFAS